MAKKEFIEAAYKTSKQFYLKDISMQDAKNNLSGIGMNEGSAFINVSVFKYLMDGERFTRTLTAPTFDFFLKNIVNDFGTENLSVCLNALSKHIEYMETKRKYRMGLLRDVYKKYTTLLNESVESENDEEETTFPEGKEKYHLHKTKERNRKLIAIAKEKYKSISPNMNCQVCKFSFVECYGELGANFIEAHHVFPISALTKETPIRIEDLAMVCSNCHRMLHRKRPWLSINDVGKLIKK
ncbi:HNH endonuclease [Ferruginibacter sp.]|nr:HNH endonuclease [Ferruginibacter sp.]